MSADLLGLVPTAGAPQTASVAQRQEPSLADSPPVQVESVAVAVAESPQASVDADWQAPRRQSATKPQRLRIAVPQYAVNGGLDEKFQADPYAVDLLGLLSEAEYEDAIARVNEELEETRKKMLDVALLASGPLMLPLIPYMMRHYKQRKRRKKLLLHAIRQFNDRNPQLLMRWHKKPISQLTIERKPEERAESKMGK